MALYLLSHDLRKGRDYAILWSELEKVGAVQVLETGWCFKRINTTSAALRDHFMRFIDFDNDMFVTELSKTNWAAYKAMGTPKDLK